MLLAADGHGIVHDLPPPWLREINIVHLVQIHEHSRERQRRHVIHLADDGLIRVVSCVDKGFYAGENVVIAARDHME